MNYHDTHTECIQLLQPIKLANGRNIVICTRNCKDPQMKSSNLPTGKRTAIDSHP
jgi:hypothetical protein